MYAIARIFNSNHELILISTVLYYSYSLQNLNVV